MNDPIHVVQPKVKLIAHTPDPEKVVALAAKLCYSNVDPEEIYESLTDEEISKYLKHLESYGHESPIEHASFTFLITGMSRSCLAQFTRHRVASFSVQSQRYIDFSNFNVATPEYVEYPAHANSQKNYILNGQENMQADIDNIFASTIDVIRYNYIGLRDRIIFMLLSKYICDNAEELFHEEEYVTANISGVDYKIFKSWYEHNFHPFSQAIYDTSSPFIKELNISDRINGLKIAFIENQGFKKELNRVSKIANENARCILPNAATCNQIVTMNARELRHFFNLRCCNRAQKEIRTIAWMMLNLCKEVAPNLFAKSGPSCLYGSCSEGAMTCGNPYKPIDSGDQ